MTETQVERDAREPVPFEEIFAREASSLLGSTPNEVSTQLGFNGLALSGGGIRSATFSLGVAQALVAKGLLEKFHYLSTVSGGGYTGGMLSWYLSDAMDGQRQEEFAAANKRAEELADSAARDKRKDLTHRFDVSKVNFPLGTGDPADKLGQRSLLRFLRQHGKYLTPGSGISALSLAAVVARGMLLNLLVWFPLATLFFLSSNYFVTVVAPAVAGVSLGLFALACVLYSIVGRISAGKPSAAAPQRGRPYGWRRRFEVYSPWVLGPAAALLVLHAIPPLQAAIGRALDELGSSQLGSANTTLVGALISLLGAGSTLLLDRKRVPTSIIAPLGAALLLLGIAIAASGVAKGIQTPWQQGWLAFFVAIAFVSGWLANLNHVGVQGYYRDRLMETFLPNLRSALDNNTGKAELAEDFALTSMGFAHGGRQRLYHLINTNVVLVDSAYRSYRTRGGDNFMLSKEYCGSRATGYIRTQQFVNGRVTLATAIATSGAAVNPNTGVAGGGVTRSRPVSVLLALLNLRLGLWVRNPNDKVSRQVRRIQNKRLKFLQQVWAKLERLRNSTPSHFRSLMYEILGRYKEDSRFLQLTDGGHFENLGLYELVRRRCKTILVVDAGADPKFEFGDLQNAFRLIETDFQVKVDFPVQLLTPLIPALPQPYPPSGTIKAAKQGWARGTIAYADGTESQLFYVTTTFVDGLPIEVNGYKAQHSEFPDESTADQFFDQHQFEAYRKLGAFIGAKLIADSDLAQRLRGSCLATAYASLGVRPEERVIAMATTSIHDFTHRTIDGAQQSLADYKGKVLLVVNVASKCGLTPHYAGMQSLYDEYKARGFEVLGFPCNQFADQEPASEADIKQFCSTKYGVTFPMFAKLDVNGAARAPLYAWLTSEPTKPDGPGDIGWNFAKFVVGKDGQIAARFSPRAEATAPEVRAAIDAALTK